MTAKIKLNAASGGGSFSLQAPSSSSNNRVMTLPDTADGTLLTTTNPKSGNIIQVVSQTKADVTTIATSADSFYNYDDASLKVTITPSSASNKIFLIGNIACSSNTNVDAMFVRFNKDGGALAGAIGDSSGNRGRMTTAAIQHSNTYPTFHSLTFLDTAGNTNSRYYNFGIAQNSGSGRNVKINDHYTTADSFGHGLFISTITAMEIAA